MTIEVIVFATGAVLLLIGMIGGGFEISIVKIPHVSLAPRILTFLAGVVFILIGLGINVRDKGYGQVSNVQMVPQTATSSTPSSASEGVPVQRVDNTIVPLRRPDPATITEEIKANLVSAIRYADQVEIAALQSLDPSVLQNAYTGEALRSEQLNIESLRSNNQLQYSTLNSQQFISFKISEDGQRAEVKLVENWTSYVYSATTQQCIGRYLNHDAPQTIFLVAGAKGWIVETIVQEATAPANMEACN